MEGHPVGQAGQGIVVGQVGKLLLRLLPVRDIPGDEQELLPRNRDDSRLEIPFFPAGENVVLIHSDPHGLPRQSRLPERLRRRLAGNYLRELPPGPVFTGQGRPGRLA